jgi:ubiquinone/menaquinone biosynthesis C-methylase UbiE
MGDHKPVPGQFDQAAVRARYDFIARWHDAIGQVSMPHRREAILALNAQPGECILDLACGGGSNFQGVMTELGASGLLVGLDYSPGMLKQAHQRVKRHHWSNVNLLLGDAARLPFADSMFDRIICTYALKVIPPYRQALDEVVRVLKPDGVFVVLDGKPSRGGTRLLNPLAQWVARDYAMSDLTCPLEDEIVGRFQDVLIGEYDFGHTFVAVARNR